MVADYTSVSAAMPMFGAQPVVSSGVSEVKQDTTAAAPQSTTPVGDTVNISAQALQQSGTLGNISGPAIEGSPLSDSSNLTTAQTSAVPTSAAVSNAMPVSDVVATTAAMTATIATTSVSVYA